MNLPPRNVVSGLGPTEPSRFHPTPLPHPLRDRRPVRMDPSDMCSLMCTPTKRGAIRQEFRPPVRRSSVEAEGSGCREPVGRPRENCELPGKCCMLNLLGFGEHFMDSDGSVTHWIERLKEGDWDEASQALWERYFEKLVRFARTRLRNYPRRVEDEEDVALSAFNSFCEAVRDGRFPNLGDRDCLWRTLLWITARKAVDRIRRYGRQKRKVLGESAISSGEDFSRPGFAEALGAAPSPEFAAMAIEEYGRLLEVLKEPHLQSLAIAKMEGCTNGMIARRLDCSVRTVERQLQLIRRKWEQEISA
jgi:RNA polymerase sigma factor (sigma-70 family)